MQPPLRCGYKGIPLIALQECGTKGAQLFQQHLGKDWQFYAADTEDNVATFWDTNVAPLGTRYKTLHQHVL